MSTDNAYLSGNFAPTHEEVTLACPEVQGTLPQDIDGFFLRIGPNAAFDPPDPSLYHPFDGDGMIHQVEFRGGQALYRNRWVQTAGLKRERAAGKALWGGFRSIGVVEPPSDMPVKNLANTAMAFHGRRLLALWEAGSPYEVSLPDLETAGECDFEGGWKHAVSAHPKVDPRTGELIVFCYSPVARPHVWYGVVDSAGRVRHETGIELPGAPVMIHDMAITTHYSLIFDMPVTFSLERVMEGGHAFDWEPENGTRVGILPRHAEGSEIRWFEVETGYIFHVFNAWEEGDQIVLDACRTPRTSILGGESGSTDLSEQARLHRYRFDLQNGSASEHAIGEVPLEFSRINERYVGVEHRYGYASRFHPTRGLLFDGILKVDHKEQRIECIELSETQFAQENVFVPRVGARGEDDGYVVGFVHDESTNTTECWITDAARFADGPIAKIRMPRRVPYGFHSHWVSRADVVGA